MKAFEEWVAGPATDGWIRDEFTGAELAWRAALEWLRDNEDAHCCGDCDQVGEWSPCPKDTAINNELEN